MSNRPEPVERPADPISVERTGHVSWRVLAVIGFMAAIVAVGIAKPWQTTSPTRQALPPVAQAPTLGRLPTPPATATPTLTPKRTLDPVIDAASGQMLCNAPSSWRLITSETDVFGQSRVMYGEDATLATGPLDPRIPAPKLNATTLNGIGVCRPNPGGLRVADLPFNEVTIWHLDSPGKATAVAHPTLLSVSLYRLGEAYFGPPSAQPTWPPGHYVLQIDGAARNGQSLWIALNFVAA